MLTNDKEAQDSPFQSEERFRTMVKEAPISIYEIDFDGSKFRRINTRFAEILGYSEEELLAKAPLDLMSDESKRKFQDLIKEVLSQNRTDFSGEFEAIGKNGQIIWGLVRAKVNFKDGKPDSLLVFDQDITERKKTEEALRLSEEKFSKAFQNAPFAVTLTSLSDGTIVDANDSALALFGYNRKEIIRKKTLEAGIWAHPEDRAEFVKELSLKGSVHNQELTLRKKNGNVFYVNLSASIIEIQGEKYFLSTFIDITDRRKTERALMENEEQFRTLAEQSPNMIFINQDGRIVYVNKKSEDIVGYSREEFYSSSFNFLNLSTPQDVEKVKLAWAKHLKGEEVPPYEYALVTREGKRIDALLATKLIDYKGSKAILGILTDISERKKAEEALSESERFYRSAFENSQDGFMLAELIYDKGRVVDLRVLKVNSAYEHQTGRKANNVVGKRVKEFDPETAQYLFDVYEEVDRTDKATHTENYSLSTNRWFDVYQFSYAKGEIGFLFRDITERKKAEGALKESEDRYRSLFSSIDEAFALHEMIFDCKGVPIDYRFLEVNGAFEKQTGLRASKIIGKTVCEVLPDLEPFWIETYGKVVITGEPVKFENFNRSLKRYYEVYAFRPLQGRFAVIFTDITDRKKMEEKLRDSQKRYQNLIETTPDFIWEIDSQGKYAYCSPQIEKLFGVKPEKMIGKTPFDMVPQSEVQKGLEIFKKIVSSSKSFYGLETTASDSHGRKVFVETNGVPFFDEHGRLLGFRGISRDVTERKKAEEAIQRQASLIDLSPDAIIVIAFDGTITFWSKGAENLYGWTKSEAIGQIIHTLLETVFPQPLEEILCEIEDKKFWTGELVHKTKKGLQVTVQSRWLGQEGEKGKIESILESNVDITEHKQLEKQVQDNERMAAIGQTAGMIGHDIRNPLQAIVSELFLARQVMAEAPKSTDTSETLESINTIQEQIDYINKIVADLQDYARPLNPEYSIVDLSDLVVSVFDTITLPDRIKLDINIKSSIKLKTDSTFVKRSITNLVNNAIQAMPGGGELGFSAQRKEECVVICVSDTGQGIPEHVKANLFKPLTTTKAKGQGLGLAVVKRLVEALNGKVSFESEEEKGTKFTIELPITL